jgi:hypothetical protein
VRPHLQPAQQQSVGGGRSHTMPAQPPQRHAAPARTRPTTATAATAPPAAAWPPAHACPAVACVCVCVWGGGTAAECEGLTHCLHTADTNTRHATSTNTQRPSTHLVVSAPHKQRLKAHGGRQQRRLRGRVPKRVDLPAHARVHAKGCVQEPVCSSASSGASPAAHRTPCGVCRRVCCCWGRHTSADRSRRPRRHTCGRAWSGRSSLHSALPPRHAAPSRR